MFTSGLVLDALAFLAGVLFVVLWYLIAWARELAAYEDAQVTDERLRRTFGG